MGTKFATAAYSVSRTVPSGRKIRNSSLTLPCSRNDSHSSEKSTPGSVISAMLRVKISSLDKLSSSQAAGLASTYLPASSAISIASRASSNNACSSYSPLENLSSEGCRVVESAISPFQASVQIGKSLGNLLRLHLAFWQFADLLL
jgi:hypothetical protein